MTIPMWPTELPRPERAGFQSEAPDGRQSTQLDAGPPRVRRRFSAAVTPIAMTIYVSSDLRARFQRFWSEDTASGSLPFLIPDWRFDLHPLLTADGASALTADGTSLLIEAWALAMFGQEKPRDVPAGIKWRISMSISLMP